MPRLDVQYRTIEGTNMRYLVALHTRSVDRSDKGREHYTTHHIPAINKSDAVALNELLTRHYQYVTVEDGPFLLERVTEVCGEVFTSSRTGRNRVVLSISEMEMIASEVTSPDFKAMAAE